MTIEAFDSELADFAEAVATTGLALTGLDGKRLLVLAFPEDALREVLRAFVRASEQYETQSTASTLWALLEPFLDDSEPLDQTGIGLPGVLDDSLADFPVEWVGTDEIEDGS